MTDDDPVFAPERLAEYGVPGAPRGFASRVMAAIEGETAVRRRRRRWPLIVGAVVAAAAALAIVGKLGLGHDAAAHGERVASQRESVSIGTRGVAVAEPGTALTWTVAGDGTAVVEQSSGHAFYRVEHGGPFEVRTPLGVVQVTGTCFSVEVTAMKNSINRDMVKGASFGAVIATAVLVTVYEGGVSLANPIGRIQVAPGDTAITRAGEPPRLADAIAAVVDPRNQELAEARARIAKLEKQLADNGDSDGDSLESMLKADPGRYYAPSQATLREMADNCRIAFDRPPFTSDGAPELVDAELATGVGISEADRAAINAAYDKVNDRDVDQIRQLFIELTGADADAAAALSLDGLEAEITAKSTDAEEIAARRAISRERAGLDPAPTSAELSHRSEIERLLRIEMALGGQAEEAAASVVGADRARELRAHDHAPGWQHAVADYGSCERAVR
jgi:hypothetical protein